MTNTEILGEVERITLAMCDGARDEAWERIAEYETRRRSMLMTLETVTPQDLDKLNQIAEKNRQLIDITHQRRDEIASLLSAFGSEPLTTSQ